MERNTTRMVVTGLTIFGFEAPIMLKATIDLKQEVVKEKIGSWITQVSCQVRFSTNMKELIQNQALALKPALGRLKATHGFF